MEEVSDRASTLYSFQANESRFGLELEGVEPELRVVRFDGHEAISSLYSFKLYIACDEELVFADVVGKPACLTILGLDDSEPRYISGIVRQISLTETGRHFLFYEIELVPPVWRMRLKTDSRIFQEQDVLQIIEQVLRDAAIPSDQYRLMTSASYTSREYCVQYQESDWDFVTRLMHTEGIYFFFAHGHNNVQLIIADDASAHVAIAAPEELLYYDGSSLLPDFNNVEAFSCTQEVRSGAVAMRDFDFKKPALSLESVEQADSESELERYEFPGGYVKPDEGDRLALVRLEAQQAERMRASGRSNCQRMVPGFLFTLEDHPLDTFNQQYLLTAVSHHGQQPGVLGADAAGEPVKYSADFHCIPSSVPYRYSGRIDKVRISGLQSAIVTGPSGEDIYTDEYGRVKVKFHWDRLGELNEHSSCWMRVAQLWAGGKWGAMFIPRIDQEVLVDFIEGDPDRPIIVGRVYHGTNPPPYDLPANKTRSTIKSDSTPGGGGSNELRFEDKAGSEEVFLHAQKDLTMATINNKNQTVGNDETHTVGNNQTIDVGVDRVKSIGANQTETVGSNKSIQVGANHSETVAANMSINVGANLSETVGGNASQTIGVMNAVTIGAAYQVTVGAAMNESVAAMKAIEVGGNSSEAIGANKSVSAGGSISEDAGKNVSVQAGKKMSLQCGDDFSLSGNKKGVISIKDELTIKVGKASIKMKKNGDITIKGKNINIKGSGNIVMKAKKILEN